MKFRFHKSRWLLLAGLLSTPLSMVQAAVIAVLGDSLSAAYGIDVDAGWVQLMAEALPEHTVVNAAISGDTSGNGLARVDQLLAEHQPDWLIVELGANDGLRGLPVGQLQSNLQQIIDKASAAGSGVILLGVKIPVNYGARYNSQFERVFQQLAERNAVYFVPFFLESIAIDPHHFQSDQVHPNAQAQPLILQTVLPVVQQALQAGAARD